MHRTIGLLAAAVAILATAGVGYAASEASKPAVVLGAPTVTPEELADLRAAAANGPQTVGTVERVTRRLDYVGKRTTTLTFPGASYVKVHFGRLGMRPGDSVTVSDPGRREVFRYGAAQAGAAGQWAMSVDGDTAVVTLHRARPESPSLGGLDTLSATLNDTIAGLGVLIDEAARGFTPAERAAEHDADVAARDKAIKAVAAAQGQDPRTESVCGNDDSVDAVCYKSSDPAAYSASKAVARLLINGTELCTAWRVGPNDRLFTANHCFTTSADAYNTEVWFNYECAVCGGYATLPPTKVWGSKVLSTDHTLDYTLFTVENFSAVKQFGYLTIDPAGARDGEQLYIPQHPEGDPTEIAMASDNDRGGACIVKDARADGYGTGTDVSYYCDTQGGSSGSPVIASGTNKVIALHHFGGCPNSGVRLDLIYAKVKKLL